jgi:hypothetical protein
MSYMDRLSGAAVASSGQNRRPHLASGDKQPERTPEELVAWAMLELAIDDTAILARYGLITRDGICKPWPMVRRTDWQGYAKVEPMIIAQMRNPHEHEQLCYFWNEPSQAQYWCDLCGCRLPAKDIWRSILENHAK